MICGEKDSMGVEKLLNRLKESSSSSLVCACQWLIFFICC